MTVVGTAPHNFRNVFELAKAYPLTGPHSAVFNRIFHVDMGHPRCRSTEQLREKYGVQQNNVQTVVSISNRVTYQQAWFNEARTSKPQTFTRDASIVDPTDGGRTCDFCSWETLTAEDSFGRFENASAVSASNLFKYCHPGQGVIMFKHHNPLEFSLGQLSDLLDVSDSWFQAAAAAAVEEAAAGAACTAGAQQAGHDNGNGHPQGQRAKQSAAGRHGLHPLFIWNCLPRAGASQFHGHAQVMLSSTPFPSLQQQREAVACYDAVHPGSSYYQDLLAAYEAVGLLRQEGSEGDRAFAYPSLAPTKDMEIFVHGSSMRSPAFQRLFYAALRALIDELGVATFNAAIHGMQLAVLSGSGGSGSGGSGAGTGTGNSFEPVIARVVSRGKLGNMASDFGGLEVFGGASIGHTDPMAVAQALDAVLQRT